MNKHMRYITYFILCILFVPACAEPPAERSEALVSRFAVNPAFAKRPQTSPVIKVIPQPRQIEAKNGVCVLSPEWSIVLASTATEPEILAGQLISQDLEALWGIKVPVQVSDTAIRNNNSGLIIIGVPKRDQAVKDRATRRGLIVNPALRPQGYLLAVEPDMICLLANEPVGAFYAAQTLRQIVSKVHTEVTAPCVMVTDWPVYNYRGFQMDITHNPMPTLEHFKYIVRTMALYKLNLFTFSIESVLDIITPDELKELSQEAKRYNVELIGNIQSGIPLKTFDGTVAKPGQAKYYEYLDWLYGQTAPLFESGFFNVNCNEVALEREKDIGENVSLDFWQHMQKVLHMVGRQYRRPVCRGDMFLKYQALLTQLPDKAVIMNFADGQSAGQTDYRPLVESVLKAKLGQFLCPSGWAEGTVYPENARAINNILEFSRAGLPFVEAGKPVLGLVLALGHNKPGPELFEANWFNILWTAECGWIPDRADASLFMGKFASAFFGIISTDSLRSLQDEVAQTAVLLAEPGHILGYRSDIIDRLYEDPFITDFHLQVPEFYGCLQEIDKLSGDVLKVLEQLAGQAKRQKETANAWAYIVRQWQFLAYKFRDSHDLAKSYTNSYYFGDYQRKSNDEIARENITWLNRIKEQATALYSEYNGFCKERYRRTHLVDNYAQLISVFDEKVTRFNNAFASAGGGLPTPSESGMVLKSLPERVVAPELVPVGPEVAKQFTWWDKNWAFRVFIRLENKLVREPIGANKFTCPVEVNLNLNRLIAEALPDIKGLPVGVTSPKPPDADIDLNSIRVVEYNENGVAIIEHPCQADKQPYFNPRSSADVNIFWVLRDKASLKSVRYFYIYFDTMAHHPKPEPEYNLSQVKLSGKNGIKNDRIKAYIAPTEGAIINSWKVRDISSGLFSSLDILNEASGFMATSVDKNLKYTLETEAQGPLMVRYRLVSPGGFYKRFTFYEDLPIVEVFTNSGLKACSNTAPGIYITNQQTLQYLFSDYQNGRFKGSQVTAENVFWSSIKRDDGLTVGLITPDNRMVHYIDYYEHQISIGTRCTTLQEYSGQAPAHFIIYADKLSEDTFNTFNCLRAVFNLTDQTGVTDKGRTLLLQRGKGEYFE